MSYKRHRFQEITKSDEEPAHGYAVDFGFSHVCRDCGRYTRDPKRGNGACHPGKVVVDQLLTELGTRFFYTSSKTIMKFKAKGPIPIGSAVAYDQDTALVDVVIGGPSGVEALREKHGIDPTVSDEEIEAARERSIKTLEHLGDSLKDHAASEARAIARAARLAAWIARAGEAWRNFWSRPFFINPRTRLTVWEGIAGENILNGQHVTRDEHGAVRLKLRGRQ